jgi:hypothetical protein
MIPVRNAIGGMGNLMFKEAYIYAQMKRGEIPDVYVQSEDYFKEYADGVKAMFSQNIEPIDRVAIHVRRGDYVNNLFYVDLMGTSYYKEAMAMFPDGKFLVFSDDISWCMKQEIFKDCEFSYRDEISDFNLMAGCKGIIMANSSYSWWAAYLSNARVVAPSEWHTDGIERTKLLDTWTKI